MTVYDLLLQTKRCFIFHFFSHFNLLSHVKVYIYILVHTEKKGVHAERDRYAGAHTQGHKEEMREGGREGDYEPLP